MSVQLTSVEEQLEAEGFVFDNYCNDVGDTKSVHIPNQFARNMSILTPSWRVGMDVQDESFAMTRNEFVLLHWAFANIKQHDNRFEAIQLPLVELCRIAGGEIKGAHDYKSWITTIRRLASRTMNFIEDGQAIVFCPFFSTCRIDMASKMVTLKLNEDLSPYFLCLDKNKTIFLYGFLRQLSSINTCLLYLSCASSRQGDYDLTVAIDHLKTAHGYNGENKRFINAILLPAIHEINRRTDLNVQISYVKNGRSIAGVKFAIEPKTKKEMTALGISPTNKRAAREKLTAEEKKSLFISDSKNRNKREIIVGRMPA